MVEWPDGRREAILFVLEEESVTSRFSIRRLAHYCLDLTDLLKTDRVVPIVIFLHSGNYDNALELGTENQTFLSFNYIECNLYKLAAELYLDSNNIVARLNLPLMRYNQREKVKVYASAVDGLVTLEDRIDHQRKYIDFIDCYANLNEQQLESYKSQYVEHSKQKEYIMGLLQQSFKEGEATLFMHLLEEKFGTLENELSDRIKSADSKTLREWSVNLLKAKRVEDVFATNKPTTQTKNKA